MRVEPKVLQHALDGLLGERRVAEGVAGPAQAYDEAVADKLTVIRASQNRDVLDARGRGRRNHESDSERGNERAHHPPPTLTDPSGWTAPDTVTPLSVLRTRTTSPIDPS